MKKHVWPTERAQLARLLGPVHEVEALRGLCPRSWAATPANSAHWTGKPTEGGE